MEVINNTTKEKSKELSSSISEMITRRPTLGYNIYPMIFMIGYKEDIKTGLFIPTYTYGALVNPAVLYDSTGAEDNNLYLKTVKNEHSIRIGNEKWERKNTDLIVSLDSKIEDIEAITKIKDLDKLWKIDLPHEEKTNFFRLYFGQLAYRCISQFAKVK